MTTRAVFMGTPDFAVPSLKALVDLGWQVMVVTQPDRKVGRKRVLTPPPVKEAALSLQLPVIQPEKIRDEDALSTIQSFQPDILVTAAYGQLLPKSLLEMSTKGAVNIHASLLPRWRGAAPIHRAILSGDEETGVTLMEMVQALDAGPMIDVRKLPILADDDVGSLHDKLADLGAELVREVLPKYVAREIHATPQPESGVTYAAKIERDDEFLNWSLSAEELCRHVRGLSPWPGASTEIDNGTAMKVWRARPVELNTDVSLQPGEVDRVDGDIVVGTGHGYLRLDVIQPAGKRRMMAVDWFSGLHETKVRFVTAEKVDGP